MSRNMRPTQATLVVSLLIWGFLVLSSATEDLALVQCKNQCKHELHNMKECREDRCNYCEAICKPFSQDGEGMYQRCMTICPRVIQKTMAIDQEGVEGGFDGVANGALKTKCNRKCTSYTPGKRCMSQRLRSMVRKMMDNEAVCESSCIILQERPLIVRCTRVCDERIPRAVDLLLLDI